MTMAPEPGTRMVWMSVRFIRMNFGKRMRKEEKCSCFTFDHIEKLTKNIVRVMRTRRGFGMELHTEDWFVFHAQALKRVIVQTFVSDLYFIFVQVAFSDTVIMILGSDQNLSAG